jgi:hypothetical protein
MGDFKAKKPYNENYLSLSADIIKIKRTHIIGDRDSR